MKRALRITSVAVISLVLIYGVAIAIYLAIAEYCLEYNQTTFQILVDNISNDNSEMQDANYKESKQLNDTLQSLENIPLYKLAQTIPIIGRQIKTVSTISDALQIVYQDVSESTFTQAKMIGLGDLTKFLPKKGSFDTSALTDSSNLINTFDKSLQKMNISDLMFSSSSSSFNIDNLIDMSTKMQTLNNMFKVSDALLSDGKTHYVMVAVMNNSELRAQGGIVAATVLLKVENQHISLVQTYPDTFYHHYSGASAFTSALPLTLEEKLMFPDTFGKWMQDASTTPDFSRTGEAVKAMFERQVSDIDVDCVIGVDATILANFMQDGYTFTTTSGIHLTKSNIAKVLTSDVYKLLPVEQQDGFFAEVSNLVFDRFINSDAEMTKTEKRDLLNSFGAAFNNRQIKFWSSIEQAQNAFRRLGISDTPNDQSNVLYGKGPAISVDYNSFASSKMDYYLLQNVSVVSDGCKNIDANGDGQVVTMNVRLQNTATDDLVKTLPDYVTGAHNSFNVDTFTPGDIWLHLMVSAPISGVILSNSKQYENSAEANYQLNAMQYNIQDVKLSPGQSVELQYKIDIGDVSLYNPNRIGGNYLQLFVTPTNSDLMNTFVDRSPCI